MKRRALFAVLGMVLAAGWAGKRGAGSSAEPPFIVEAGEELRDAVRALPPAPPSAAMPSRVAVWASPALRRREAERVLLSGRRARDVRRTGVIR